jgi:hypothetical protein
LDSSLNDVLSEQESEVEQPEQQAETLVEQEQVQETTGDTAAPPADKQDDTVETHKRGLEAAALAERRKRQELERERDTLRQEFEAFKRQHQPQQQAEKDGPPDPAKYQDNPQEYWRLLAQHEARAALKAELDQRDKSSAAERQQAEFQRSSEAVITAGRQKYADFDAVINDGLAPALTPALQQALVFAGGPDVAYFLGKNPTEALRLAHLPPPALLVELGELRGSLKRPAAPAPAPRLPQTLTQTRDARGQFADREYAGATPLDAVLNRKT